MHGQFPHLTLVSAALTQLGGLFYGWRNRLSEAVLGQGPELVSGRARIRPSSDLRPSRHLVPSAPVCDSDGWMLVSPSFQISGNSLLHLFIIKCLKSGLFPERIKVAVW